MKKNSNTPRRTAVSTVFCAAPARMPIWPSSPIKKIMANEMIAAVASNRVSAFQEAITIPKGV